MSEPSIHFECVTLSSLKQWGETGDYLSKSVWPITPHRLLSYINNPRAEDDDVVLMLAFLEDELVGYIASVPEYLYIGSETPQRFSCFSTLWVAEHVRGHRLGQRLIAFALQTWENKTMIVGYVPFTKKFYDNIGILDKSPYVLEGLRLHFKLGLAELLPQRNARWKTIKPLLWCVDTFGNALLNLRTLLIKPVSNYVFERVESIDEEVGTFIATHQQKSAFKRDRTVFNWILQYPWLSQEKTEVAPKKPYHFSWKVSRFEQHALVLRHENGEIAAFVLLKVRDKAAELSYIFTDSSIIIADLSAALHLYLAPLSLQHFTVFWPPLVQQAQKSQGFAFYSRPFLRYFLFLPAMRAAFANGEYELQAGDGESVFT